MRFKTVGNSSKSSRNYFSPAVPKLQGMNWVRCLKTVKTNFLYLRFGYKRKRLDNTYPNLCHYYDEFFYQNDYIATQFIKGDLIYLERFKIT